jgi:hypothetical protein
MNVERTQVGEMNKRGTKENEGNKKNKKVLCCGI